jgi:putative membrane protein
MRSLFTYWHLDGFMAIFLLSLGLLYFYETGFKYPKKSIFFIAGLLMITISVGSPLDFLGENYLLSAHMLSHVLVLLVATPLLVLGIPDQKSKWLYWLGGKLRNLPWLAWFVGVSIMWFWHIPAIFNQLFEDPAGMGSKGAIHSAALLSDIHVVSLIAAGIVFCWPVIGPVHSYRIAPLKAVLYLSVACIFCSILGLLITFAPLGIYPHYMHLQDPLGFLNIIRNEDGISTLVDQQIAGLIMWVPGCAIYLSASMYLLIKWFEERKEKIILVNPRIV